MFYGTAVAGGAIGAGTVFGWTPRETWSFCTPSTSAMVSTRRGPDSGSGRPFYGTTVRGGGASPWNPGPVFKMDGAGNVTTLHSFVTTGGSFPFAPLVRATDGSFYGTTNDGGTSNNGIAFRLDAAGSFTSLTFFLGRIFPGLFRAAKLQPDAGRGRGLLRDVALRPSTSAPSSGWTPRDDDDSPSSRATTGQSNGPLVQTKDGSFYGATEAGLRSATPRAELFRMVPVGRVSTLHFFREDGGGYHSFAGLHSGRGQNFYGTALRGGVERPGSGLPDESHRGRCNDPLLRRHGRHSPSRL